MATRGFLLFAYTLSLGIILCDMGRVAPKQAHALQSYLSEHFASVIPNVSMLFLSGQMQRREGFN